MLPPPLPDRRRPATVRHWSAVVPTAAEQGRARPLSLLALGPGRRWVVSGSGVVHSLAVPCVLCVACARVLALWVPARRGRAPRARGSSRAPSSPPPHGSAATRH
eukprot:1778091-Alexandrium_andersonii.AAC.1